MAISYDDVVAARERGKQVVLTTPLLPSQSFSALSGREVWLKAENLQRTGSFKIRGAMNALSQLSAESRERGVVAASAGNHAQGVALAAKTLGIPATVFMPRTAAIPKVAATRGYGADVRLVGDHIGDCVDAAHEFRTETGATFIHPYDDAAIITGQGTMALELLEQVPGPATIVIPVGGGGLISGSAIAIKAHRPEVRIVGVEAEAMPLYVTSRSEGKPTDVPFVRTVADGIAVARASTLAFEIMQRHVDEVVTVSDAQINETVALLLERAKFLVEPAGAAGLAALLHGKVGDGPEPAIAVLSGGNIDLLLVETVVRHGMEARGRFGSFRVRVPDVPGQLHRVTTLLAEKEGNVLSVEHHREGAGLDFGLVEIRMSIATRGHEHFDEIVSELRRYYEVILDSSPGSPESESILGS